MVLLQPQAATESTKPVIMQGLEPTQGSSRTIRDHRALPSPQFLPGLRHRFQVRTSQTSCLSFLYHHLWNLLLPFGLFLCLRPCFFHHPNPFPATSRQFSHQKSGTTLPAKCQPKFPEIPPLVSPGVCEGPTRGYWPIRPQQAAQALLGTLDVGIGDIALRKLPLERTASQVGL